jgi:hypothetical protein
MSIQAATPPVTKRDMRAFLGELERAGELRRVTDAVDPAWEPGSLVKWMFQALPDDQRFGLLLPSAWYRMRSTQRCWPR